MSHPPWHPVWRLARETRFALLICVIGGVLNGELLHRLAVARSAAEAPSGWREVPADVQDLTAHTGPLSPTPGAWALDGHRGLRRLTGGPSMGPRPIEATVQLPRDGQVEVWTAQPEATATSALGLIVDRFGDGAARVDLVTPEGRRPASCSRALPAPGAAPLLLALSPGEDGVTMVKLGETIIACRGAITAGSPVVRAGARRVLVHGLSVGGVDAPRPTTPPAPLWWILGGLAGGLLVAGERSLGTSARALAWSSLPLLLAAPMVFGGHIASSAPGAKAVALSLIGVVMTLAIKFALHLARALREPGPAKGWPLAAPMAAMVPWALAVGGAAPEHVYPRTVGAAVVLGSAVTFALVRFLRTLGSHTPARSVTLMMLAGSITAATAWAQPATTQVACAWAWAAGVVAALGGWAFVNRRLGRGRTALTIGAAVGTLMSAELLGQGSADPTPRAGSGQGMFARPEHRPPPPRSPHVDSDLGVRGLQGDGRPRVMTAGGPFAPAGGSAGGSNIEGRRALEYELDGAVLVVPVGRPGWTLTDLAAALPTLRPQVRPDVVVMVTGRAAGQGASRAGLPAATLDPRRTHLWWWTWSLGRHVLGLPAQVALSPGDAAATATEVADKLDNVPLVLVSEPLRPDPGARSDHRAALAAVAAARADIHWVDGGLVVHRDVGTFEAAGESGGLNPHGARILAGVIADRLRTLGLMGN